MLVVCSCRHTVYLDIYQAWNGKSQLYLPSPYMSSPHTTQSKWLLNFTGLSAKSFKRKTKKKNHNKILDHFTPIMGKRNRELLVKIALMCSILWNSREKPEDWRWRSNLAQQVCETKGFHDTCWCSILLSKPCSSIPPSSIHQPSGRWRAQPQSHCHYISVDQCGDWNKLGVLQINVHMQVHSFMHGCWNAYLCPPLNTFIRWINNHAL